MRDRQIGESEPRWCFSLHFLGLHVDLTWRRRGAALA